jgi:uncharacterized protein YndB with AHSA1/START domain
LSGFSLVSEWRLGVPIERVWEALVRPQEWPRWWRYVEAAVPVAAGNARGIGARTSYVWSSRLPYRLVFEMRTTRTEPPLLLEGEASGDLEGRGRWLLARDAGTTAVRYEWQVHTTRRWMNVVGPLLAPLFAWNHDQVMRAGGRGLAEYLGARYVSCRSQRAASHATLFG